MRMSSQEKLCDLVVSTRLSYQLNVSMVDTVICGNTSSVQLYPINSEQRIYSEPSVDLPKQNYRFLYLLDASAAFCATSMCFSAIFKEKSKCDVV